MKLSVVIVNYNVKHFLEQCLRSVREACRDLEAEIWVVDNNSVDGSVAMVQEKFPDVHLIANTENLGFSRANNQAILQSNGEYVLLLNPDTVVSQDTFASTLQFMDAHPDAGGLGVKMVDGKGRFLPESKRSLPTPAVAFYKIFGLSRIFPRSKTFGRYHLGYLDDDKVHSIEVLSGAFMLMRRAALDKAGLLDEQFFMYGEDIDLSYRITQAGYKNYYFPETQIIHYKGESTKKGSANYVFTFYQAMNIFARKHFSKNNARVFTFLINLAIWLRAGMALLQRGIRRAFLPLSDLLLLYGGIYLMAQWWENNVLANKGSQFPEHYFTLAIPLYLLIWLLSIHFSGGYDRPYRIRRALTGIFTGTVLILVIYALLPTHLRFSRAVLLLGSVWGLLSTAGLRYLFRMGGIRAFQALDPGQKHLLIVGDKEEARRVESLLNQAKISPGFTGIVSPDPIKKRDDDVLGNLDRIRDLISIYKITELIFCSKSLPAARIIDLMASLQDTGIEFKIAPPESLTVIGSNSINTSGELYMIEMNTIGRPENVRLKRLFDLALGSLILLGSPALIWLMEKPGGLIPNMLSVIRGKKSLIGYIPRQTAVLFRLPAIRTGILNPSDLFPGREIPEQDKDRMNMLYAKNYRLSTDLEIFLRAFRTLGRKEQKPG
jgi:GT2 family glycosyltransferase